MFVGIAFCFCPKTGDGRGKGIGFFSCLFFSRLLLGKMRILYRSLKDYHFNFVIFVKALSIQRYVGWMVGLPGWAACWDAFEEKIFKYVIPSFIGIS